VHLTDITRFIVDAFRNVGAQDSHALQMARTLVTADLKGHFSHGLNRLGEFGYIYIYTNVNMDNV
jgi:LDH2 family malate/lactate/ureidoglycolate dehydrogenase